MQLSLRLSAIAGLVTRGNRLVDVGCDHGYLPVSLYLDGKIPGAIAMDVRKGPLSRAQEHISQYGLDAYIETRLSDGLEALKPGEGDTLVIAGMGGPLMERILTDGAEVRESFREMILQPQSDIPHFRRFVRKIGWQITVIAVIDSGIDYLNPIFRNGDVSRIAYIWNQTIPGNEDEQVPYGKVFTGEEINQALLSENPQEIVPSLDENGHGTAMAGLAAGNFVPTENFSGAAPKATIIVVKLKKAKSYLRKFYQYPPQAPVFQEDDIMLGISFAVKMAQEMGMPVSVCLGLGTNQSAHVGDSELSRYVDYINEDSQVSVSVAAGNEGAAQHHYTAELDYVKNQDTVELRIADKEEGFSMEFWGDPPDDYGISLLQGRKGGYLDRYSRHGVCDAHARSLRLRPCRVPVI